MKRLSIIILLVITAGVLHLMFNGPRMRHQPSINTFEARMPLPPAGSIAFNTIKKKSSYDENPVELNEENLKIGKNLYGYYCAFCHGVEGRGEGPVAESYVPAPVNFKKTDWSDRGDNEFYESMLQGEGHEPVLSRITEDPYRWYIVLYVRHSLIESE